MAVNWLDLRPFNGSQHAAFEELCCQLAAAEAPLTGSLFIRKGAPDAGVECYWVLPDASEWGWQAKFFLSPPDGSQWAQIDKSVTTALEKHSRLSQYVVCLPIDRQDPRIDNQQRFMNKWDEHVQRWERWASAKGMAVVFEYWGTHELFARLSREEHRGRYYFWFHRDLFSQEWFRSRIEEAIANVGPRYSPELDVQLSIARLFHGLGRTPEFYTRVQCLLKEIKKLLPHSENSSLFEKSQQLSEALDRLWKLLETVAQGTVEHIDWDGVSNITRTVMELSRDCAHTLSRLAEAQEKEPDAKEKREEIYRLKALAAHYWRLSNALQELHEYAASDEARLSNLPTLLLIAEAGRGKTHLFCDVAQHRMQGGMPTVLLIGGQFNHDEPWAQMTGLLGLSCTREEFLGALEAAAQAHHTRGYLDRCPQ